MPRVLVLSPHPDDEAIGCGGTICKHVAQGDEVRVIFLTSGERGGHGIGPADTALLREAEAAAATTILGVTEIEFWRAPDGRMRATAALVRRLVSTLRGWRPDVVYTTHPGESHSDHRAAARILSKALATSRVRRPVSLLFEVWTPISQMDHIVDVTEWMPTKLRAVRQYRSQCAVLRFDKAVAGLNRYRGELHCWPGGDFAEVFSALEQ